MFDVEDEEKEQTLVHHSEKLAIAFCLLSTPPGEAIRVTKNLRVCTDCHTTIKLRSRIAHREIIIRDYNRLIVLGMAVALATTTGRSKKDDDILSSV
jgi:hypothetical protein